jgi:hypothetical protein
VAKAKKTRTTAGETPRDPPQLPEANPHFLGRFAPTRLAVPPLYRTHPDSLGTITPAEQRQYRHLRAKALRAGLDDAPPPPSPRGRKALNDDSLLPELGRFLHRAERAGLTRRAALRRWIAETKEGKQLRGRTTGAIIKRLERKLREIR